MRFPPLCENQKKFQSRFLELILKQEEDKGLSLQENQEIKELSLLIIKQSQKVPAIHLSASELAHSLGLSLYKIKQWIEAKELPARKLSTGRYELLSSQIYYPLKQKGYNLFK